MNCVEIITIAEDLLESIKLAREEAEENSIFEKIVKDLEATYDEVEEIRQEYIEEARKQHEEEQEYMNSEYMRSVS